MAHYQLTTATNGKCLMRLVEDNYDANGNIVTTVLGNWEYCDERVGVPSRTDGYDKPESRATFRAKRTERYLPPTIDPDDERNNLLMVGVIAVFVGIILYKIK